MGKTVLVTVLMMLVAVSAVFAEGANEQSVRDDYGKKGGFSTRDVWLYEFNSIAAKVIEDSNSILNGGHDKFLSLYQGYFDESCVKYKVLLDIGVELKYITDTVRKQQMVKAEDERRKVAKYLASKSSGLGLE